MCEVCASHPMCSGTACRISFCSADASFDRVVAFIGTHSNEVMECHAFLCAKRRVAQAAALTISQAFQVGAISRMKECLRTCALTVEPVKSETVGSPFGTVAGLFFHCVEQDVETEKRPTPALPWLNTSFSSLYCVLRSSPALRPLVRASCAWHGIFRQRFLAVDSTQGSQTRGPACAWLSSSHIFFLINMFMRYTDVTGLEHFFS